MFGISCFVLPAFLDFPGFGFSPAFISPGGSEFLLIMLVLIMLFGAKDAPRIFRGIHNALDKLQRAAASFRYKIMYGDLHQDTPSDDLYDVDADYVDADDEHEWQECPESEEQGSESEPEKQTESPESESSKPKA
ncbi:hypothetical protein [Tichowtungia aerotolerans]|uniref:Uncharacterized protein n=1 Tax=Tichowtungia aerotolerans TaxID=2697043 RepID=A0A6P1M2M0_9BACT|nr:hypothetical protein [Tichowtungia aerotolerans]QHI69079.1 hypothetical protein GT409_06340 [Tichowtungia aerotolerans]